MEARCYCGKRITGRFHRCSCGRKWLLKIRNSKYVFAGWWK